MRRETGRRVLKAGDTRERRGHERRLEREDELLAQRLTLEHEALHRLPRTELFLRPLQPPLGEVRRAARAVHAAAEAHSCATRVDAGNRPFEHVPHRHLLVPQPRL